MLTSGTSIIWSVDEQELVSTVGSPAWKVEQAQVSTPSTLLGPEGSRDRDLIRAIIPTNYRHRITADPVSVDTLMAPPVI
jgi:hypothetical protein